MFLSWRNQTKKYRTKALRYSGIPHKKANKIYQLSSQSRGSLPCNLNMTRPHLIKFINYRSWTNQWFWMKYWAHWIKPARIFYRHLQTKRKNYHSEFLWSENVLKACVWWKILNQIVCSDWWGSIETKNSSNCKHKVAHFEINRNSVWKNICRPHNSYLYSRSNIL